MSFHRLVRFVDEHEDVQYGEASMLPWNDSLEGQNVPLYRGGDPWEQTFSLSAEEATICRVGNLNSTHPKVVVLMLKECPFRRCSLPSRTHLLSMVLD